MSDLDTRPREQRVGAPRTGGAEQLVITGRRVPLGKTTEVMRTLPDRQVRMIGAWCFLDHYGPEELGDRPGMQVWAHPHTGLQTVSWLLEGAVEHRDSLGSEAMVRPGELNLMTAGRGIVHSEISPPDRPSRLHGVQLWVALPAGARDREPAFTAYADLPELFPAPAGASGTVLLGELNGVRSPAEVYTPIGGADVRLEAGATAALDLASGWEHGVFVVAGEVVVDGTTVGRDQLLYLGPGRSGLTLTGGRTGGRVLLLGGEPFGEEIVMWWNFIGRSHDEVVGYRDAWAQRADRFPPVVARDERVMEAPPLPSVALKPRPHRVVRP